MKWSELERCQPRLAEVGRQRLLGPGVVLVATIRRDGTPRLSPVEPLIMDGVLWLSMLWRSQKAMDLMRDPRVLVHGVVTSRDGGEGEFKVRGHARNEQDEGVQRRYAETVTRELGWKPEPGHFHLFAIDIDHLSYLRYDDASGDQCVTQWPPGREYVRRGTTATSLSGPEPLTDVLVRGDER
jgi:hypothetical protein